MIIRIKLGICWSGLLIHFHHFRTLLLYKISQITASRINDEKINNI